MLRDIEHVTAQTVSPIEVTIRFNLRGLPQALGLSCDRIPCGIVKKVLLVDHMVVSLVLPGLLFDGLERLCPHAGQRPGGRRALGVDRRAPLRLYCCQLALVKCPIE